MDHLVQQAQLDQQDPQDQQEVLVLQAHQEQMETLVELRLDINFQQVLLYLILALQN